MMRRSRSTWKLQPNLSRRCCSTVRTRLARLAHATCPPTSLPWPRTHRPASVRGPGERVALYVLRRHIPAHRFASHLTTEPSTRSAIRVERPNPKDPLANLVTIPGRVVAEVGNRHQTRRRDPSHGDKDGRPDRPDGFPRSPAGSQPSDMVSRLVRAWIDCPK